jgi:hypothetical protein
MYIVKSSLKTYWIIFSIRDANQNRCNGDLAKYTGHLICEVANSRYDVHSKIYFKYGLPNLNNIKIKVNSSLVKVKL